jgi:hypothetical protein
MKGGPSNVLDVNAINTNTKLMLVVFFVFFLALALAALWML